MSNRDRLAAEHDLDERNKLSLSRNEFIRPKCTVLLSPRFCVLISKQRYIFF